MKKIMTFLPAVLISLSVFATAQYPDKLIYNGKDYDLNCNPLESYFKEHPDKKPKGGISSTALWRGYVATFEIRDNQFFVKDIKILVPEDTGSKVLKTEWKSVISEVFPDVMKVDWFTGYLVLPYGKLVNYVHMGYGSTYENYLLLEIEKGDFKKELKFKSKEYEEFKEKQFQAFKKTDEYRKQKEDLMKDGDSEEFIDSFLRSYMIEYTTIILKE